MEWRLRRQIARALARQPPATLRPDTDAPTSSTHLVRVQLRLTRVPTPTHLSTSTTEPARACQHAPRLWLCSSVLALTQRACHTFHSAASAGDVFHSALNMKEGPLRRQHQLGHPRRFRRCCYLPQPHTDAAARRAAEQKNRATWQMQGTGRGRRDPNLVGGWKRARGHARGRRCGGPGRMGGACRVAHLNEHASGAIE